MNEKYILKCPDCGRVVSDRYTNTCPHGCTGLLRAYYREKQLKLTRLPGIFRYSCWLPVSGSMPVDSAPVTYRSEGLAEVLGVKNLFISFSGYWPERGAQIKTCSFKELEALPTMVRMKERGSGILQISSAGNTGRAFCQMSALTGTPVVVVVPESSAGRLWTTEPAENVCLITVQGDYTDSTELGNEVCKIAGIIPEGGARNVARRDGMGTVMLNSAVTTGRLPDYYFQAIGSGTGGIAAWEASERLIADGRYGDKLPRLCLVQNEPFAPILHAWEKKRHSLIPDIDMPDAKRSISTVYADVLTNRYPPYAMKGGLFDALTATDGQMSSATNREAELAEKIFIESEGIDPDPAASVCVAGLKKAVEEGSPDKNANILLNIAGGGYERVREDHTQYTVKPFLKVQAGRSVEDVRDEISGWMRDHA
ncbi:MAG: cysteate synthase [Euryarchaeota archaeon]|nr:cysteate synthase [Euryarchaeota archaeon]